MEIIIRGSWRVTQEGLEKHNEFILQRQRNDFKKRCQHRVDDIFSLSKKNTSELTLDEIEAVLFTARGLAKTVNHFCNKQEA